MLLSKRDFRAIAFYEYAKGTSEAACHESLVKLFGENAPEKGTLEDLYKEFRKNRAYLNGAEEKPKTKVLTTEFAEGARRLIKNDPRIQRQEFEKWLDISPSAVDALLDDHLCLIKRWDYWVPRTLSKEDKKDRLHWCRLYVRTFDNGVSPDLANLVTSGELWIFRYDDDSNAGSWSFDINESARILNKRMLVCFFSRASYLATIPLDEQLSRQTVLWWTATCLPQILAAWNSKNSEKRELWLHHARTQPITAPKTIETIHEKESRLFPHPPHAPDLLPTDFFLFPRVRSEMHTRRFRTVEEAIDAYEKYIQKLEPEIWQKVFKTWLQRIKSCTIAEGDFFEEA